uniref:Retrovirus-related Pol polyprotein from transposon TNT 1-94 n=1 Tax=Cajanus cajan TaxID=3821 RepID=A0A151S1K1_CAJCA|nr:Retrovirus-related Pol polyprotein from transposon TNT 1-94 [Cajanus cajan]
MPQVTQGELGSPTPPNVDLRRSTRHKQAPTYLIDYHCNLLQNIEIHDSKNIRYSLSSVLSYHSLNPEFLKFSLSITTEIEPKNYQQAAQSPHWIKAMQEELGALKMNKTWCLTPLPIGKFVIGSKWVYKIKYNSDGTLQRYKARLVAKGYNQTEGLDYFDTFAPVAKLTIVRLLLALASTKNWFLHQLDINNAFLHGDLTEEVYMKVPQGLSVSDSTMVCKLQKSIYGLKQASRQWFAKLSTFLFNLGYKQSCYDHSLFIKKFNSKCIIILVYVNDLILAGDDAKEIAFFKQSLDNTFKIKDLGKSQILPWS